MQIAIQENKCSGCKLCQQVCTIHHFKEQNPKKAAIAIKAEFPVPGRFSPKLCNQCGDCAYACPNDAINLRGGAYVIDNMIWSGRVADDENNEDSTVGIRAFTYRMWDSPEYLSSLLPIRDGVVLSLRLR